MLARPGSCFRWRSLLGAWAVYIISSARKPELPIGGQTENII
jgi:hypothetical protein